MSIKQCCTQDVQYVEPQTTITDVAKRMKDNDCGSILVGENNKLTGMITDRDIVLRCVAESLDPLSISAEQCMSPEVLYCFEDDSPRDVLDNMAQNGVRRMPVVNKDKDLVGIVSFTDVASLCEDKNFASDAMDRIKEAA